YYRRWMHELPPLIHRTRDRMIDVHHTILPLTARPRPDAEALIAASVALENGLRTLSPADIIVHAAAHLFADGDLAGGLRNLWDIDRLLREWGAPDFWRALGERARLHQLGPHVARALRLSKRLYGTPVDKAVAGRPRVTDRLFEARLLARNGWGQEKMKALRFAFYLRSHWLRMPPLMLARHLWIKATR
ncbi:MAG TPA: nucleotidyltransferase family protein, partial [Allosphingosinicella sp.]|nr:nucleotidyltransferase family protein [Allosphingosinicella sp.]